MALCPHHLCQKAAAAGEGQGGTEGGQKGAKRGARDQLLSRHSFEYRTCNASCRMGVLEACLYTQSVRPRHVQTARLISSHACRMHTHRLTSSLSLSWPASMCFSTFSIVEITSLSALYKCHSRPLTFAARRRAAKAWLAASPSAELAGTSTLFSQAAKAASCFSTHSLRATRYHLCMQFAICLLNATLQTDLWCNASVK